MPEGLMNPIEFERALDIYGADLARWPAATAAQARALLDTSPAAAALHRQARALAVELDAAFDAASLTSGAVRARVLAAIAAPPRNRLAEFAAQWLRPVVFGLIPLCLGFALGVGYPPQSDVSNEQVSDVSLFAFDAYQDYADAQQ
jgi:hypothetical protein